MARCWDIDAAVAGWTDNCALPRVDDACLGCQQGSSGTRKAYAPDMPFAASHSLAHHSTPEHPHTPIHCTDALPMMWMLYFQLFSLYAPSSLLPTCRGWMSQHGWSHTISSTCAHILACIVHPHGRVHIMRLLEPRLRVHARLESGPQPVHTSLAALNTGGESQQNSPRSAGSSPAEGGCRARQCWAASQTTWAASSCCCRHA